MTAAAQPALLDRPLPGQPSTRPQRQAALAELAAVGWPSPQRERWRYTNLTSLGSGDLDPAPAKPGAAELEAAQQLLTGVAASADRRLVFVDGHLVPELGALSIDGIEFETLESAPSEPHIAAADHPLAAVNTAYGQTTMVIRSARGARGAESLHLIFVASSKPSLAPQPRVVLDAGEDSALNVVQHFIAAPNASGWVNAVTQIRQRPRSSVELYRLQQSGHTLAHTSLIAADLERDAQLRVGYFDLGGRLVRNDIDVRLSDRGAATELFGLLLVPTGEHVDDHLRVDHAAPDTRSIQAFRGIIGRRGRGVFNGKVIVRPGAQRIDAQQSNDNLLLGEQAEIDTKPELEIYADDVKCSHGTTVGELDAEQLFYLRARGIDEAAARGILTTAFAETVLERIGPAALREGFSAAVRQALASITEQSQ